MYTTQIHPSIYRITTPYEGGGTVFLYLLKGDQVALVDTGTVSSPKNVLAPALAEIGMAFSAVDMILCTHGHLDHAGGNVGAKEASGAKIYMHPADFFLAQSLEAEIKFHTDPLRALDFPQSFIEGRRSFISSAAGENKVPVDVELADGDVLDLGAGVRLRIVPAPGHTPGHVVPFWEEEGILFTSDAAQGQGGRIGGYPYYFEASTYRKSLSAMAGLDARMLCMGHAFLGGGIISSPTREGEDVHLFLQESIRVADAVHSAVVDAMKRLPGASKREVALAALSELIYQVPQLLLRETQMPGSAGPTLFAHIQAAMDGTYPT